LVIYSNENLIAQILSIRRDTEVWIDIHPTTIVCRYLYPIAAGGQNDNDDEESKWRNVIQSQEDTTQLVSFCISPTLNWNQPILWILPRCRIYYERIHCHHLKDPLSGQFLKNHYFDRIVLDVSSLNPKEQQQHQKLLQLTQEWMDYVKKSKSESYWPSRNTMPPTSLIKFDNREMTFMDWRMLHNNQSMVQLATSGQIYPSARLEVQLCFSTIGVLCEDRQTRCTSIFKLHQFVLV